MTARPLLSDLQLEPFKDLLLRTCGFSFDSGRCHSLRSGLYDRMDKLEIRSPMDYHVLLNQDQHEIHRLVELLTVNETYFFRESEYLDLMIRTLIPELIAERSIGRLRIVSAGCSTGEESYSIAMLLNELLGSETLKRFEIAGIDIDGTAISRAIKGVYGKYSFRSMNPVYIQKYFEPADEGFLKIREEIKSRVTFQTANLCSREYPEIMVNADIILYRNVSIYFPGQVQEEIFRRLSDCLNTGGYMIVSATETLHHDLGILSLLEKNGLFVYRKLPGTLSGDRRQKRREQNESVRSFKGAKKRTALPSPAPVKSEKKSGGKNVRKLFDDAMEHARDNRTNLALSVLDELIGEDKSFVNAHALKASLLINSHRLDEAEAACDEAIKLDTFCVSARLMLGITAHQKGLNEKAMKHFRESVYLDSSCWPGHFYMAEITHLMDEKKRAAAGYQRTLEILDHGELSELGTKYFPLVFNARQFLDVCRHKLAVLKKDLKQ